MLTATETARYLADRAAAAAARKRLAETLAAIRAARTPVQP